MSAKGKEYELAIRISGIIDKNFDTSLVAANKKLSGFKATVSAMDSNFTKLDKGFDSVMKTGKKCFTAIATAAGVATVAIGAATAAAIAVGVQFESAFAGVKKTVDATEAEYARLKQDILDMTRTMPSSASEIAGVMEIAGQLGVANESLTDFTETMVNLGVATNMSAEDAATALARFANIMNMDDYGEDGISNYERLGSVITALGNNFATTEEEIVNMATRLASTGSLVGLSEAQIMALSAAMSSVGIKEESGGSTMSKLLKKMQIAVETGSDILADYAAVSGMSSDQFVEAFQEDAVGAMVAFIDGLTDMERNGKSAVVLLDEMGLTEIRLSNTILALSGSTENMGDALELANKAWEENNALAIEAGKRYETTESQLEIMRNAFQELGIVAYDELQGPFVSVIGTITEKVHGLTEKLGGANGISKWIKDIGTELPTLQRKFKKFGEPVFNGIMGVGKWIVKNGKGIISVFTGIGAALAAYKIASTITHIVNSLMALSPTSWIIIGVAAAIASLVAAFTAYKLHEKEMVNADLAAHFGDIALSMEDIQAIAEYIVSSDSLGGVKKALEAFEDLDEISATMENAISEIDKMNWKVSIGMELTPDEQESYKTTIEEYVTAAKEYALQSRYAVSLNLSMGFSDDDLESQNVVSKVEQFYADKYDELAALGTQLNTAVTDAFNDGLLEIDEIETITKIQKQMAEIEKALATGEFEAQLSLLGMEYADGSSLSADAFQNLQAELSNQVAEAEQAYKESYMRNLVPLQNAYKGGALTEAEFQAAEKALQENYLKEVGDLELRAIQFQIETIKNAYGEEFAELNGIIDDVVAEYFNDERTWDWENRPVIMFDAMIEEAFNRNDISKSTKKAIEQLLEEMEPSIESMEALRQKYADAGIELSDEMIQAFADLDLLGAITARRGDNLLGTGFAGDQQAARTLMEQYIVNNEELQELEELLRGYGWALPEEVAAGIEESAATSIAPAIDGMYAFTSEYLMQVFAQGIDVNTGVKLSPDLLYPWQKIGTLPNFGINQRANGGLATRPELTWFAEKGPEMAIPIDGSQNAISLWEQTGRLLGMDSVLDGLALSGGGSAPTIEYKPTLQFYGGSPSREDLDGALKVSQDDFEVLMRQWLKDNARVAF